MTEHDLAQMESKLQIALPAAYRALMLERASELKDAGCFNDDLSAFYLDPTAIISANLFERRNDSGTGYAFPKWWETYFLVGTNGGGDYYCLHLHNKPGVWMIGSDCGDRPTQVAQSLEAYVDERLNKHEERNRREARRLAAMREEAVEVQGCAGVDEKRARQWMTASVPQALFGLLDNLGRKPLPRKMRLFGIACCRRLPDLMADPECRQAVQLAEELANDRAFSETVNRLRTRLKERYLSMTGGGSRFMWCVGAAKNLLQDDDDYLNEAPIYAGDADLSNVWYCARSAVFYNEAEQQAQADLLREVLGNPFNPVRVDPGWQTAAVVGLAQTIDDQEAFEHMPSLAEELVKAGCRDERVLKHCRKTGAHARGCWVVDALLGRQDLQAEEDFTWDFTWEHPTIDPLRLKRRLQEFGTGTGDGQVNDQAALRFAGWLEENGDRAWAKYIRVRCELDGKAPGADYADLFEQFLEAAAGMRPGRARFEELYFSGYRFGNSDWWGSDADDMERGLPSSVDAVQPGQQHGPEERLIKVMQALVANTPVRGTDFDWHHAEEMATILKSPGAGHLRRISFANRPAVGQIGPVIQALAQSPVVRTLEWLDIHDGIMSDADALALAEAGFDRLRRLDVHALVPVSCSASAASRLLTAPWFRLLERTLIGFSEECCETGMIHLAGMPRLHTLGLWIPPDRQMLALAKAGEFPALKRLFIHHAKLTGDHGEAFFRLQAPQLLELWLRNSAVTAADVDALAAAPLFGGLRALTFDGTRIDEKGLEAVAASGCARWLRILRISGDGDMTGSFRSLDSTPLTRPGAFPELTTLELKYPYGAKARTDTAKFLKKLATPKLRHLTLAYCGLDDECADVLGNCPALGSLTRLILEDATLSTKAAEKLLRSPNLQRLIELKIKPPYGEARAALGEAAGVCLDLTVMPLLSGGWFSTSGVAMGTIERLQTARPGLVISQ
jgi:uncharacterized protein (TIGR02996 family)